MLRVVEQSKIGQRIHIWLDLSNAGASSFTVNGPSISRHASIWGIAVPLVCVRPTATILCLCHACPRCSYLLVIFEIIVIHELHKGRVEEIKGKGKGSKLIRVIESAKVRSDYISYLHCSHVVSGVRPCPRVEAVIEPVPAPFSLSFGSYFLRRDSCGIGSFRTELIIFFALTSVFGELATANFDRSHSFGPLSTALRPH